MQFAIRSVSICAARMIHLRRENGEIRLSKKQSKMIWKGRRNTRGRAFLDTAAGRDSSRQGEGNLLRLRVQEENGQMDGVQGGGDRHIKGYYQSC